VNRVDLALQIAKAVADYAAAETRLFSLVKIYERSFTKPGSAWAERIDPYFGDRRDRTGLREDVLFGRMKQTETLVSEVNELVQCAMHDDKRDGTDE